MWPKLITKKKTMYTCCPNDSNRSNTVWWKLKVLAHTHTCASCVLFLFIHFNKQQCNGFGWRWHSLSIYKLIVKFADSIAFMYILSFGQSSKYMFDSYSDTCVKTSSCAYGTNFTLQKTIEEYINEFF